MWLWDTAVWKVFLKGAEDPLLCSFLLDGKEIRWLELKQQFWSMRMAESQVEKG